MGVVDTAEVDEAAGADTDDAATRRRGPMPRLTSRLSLVSV
jgi:hypothetical protein